MAVTKVATARANNGQTAGTATATVVMPAAAAVGDVAVFCMAENAITGTFTAPADWTAMRPTPDGINSNLQAQIWKKQLTAGDLGGSFSFTSSNGFRLPGVLVVLRGTSAAAVSVVAPTSSGGTATTTHTTPAVTTTVDQTWIQAFWVLRTPQAAPGSDLTAPSAHTLDDTTKTAFTVSPNVTVATSHRTTTGAAGAYGGVSGTSSIASTSIVYSLAAAPVGAGPVASFTAVPLSGTSPLTVSFTDTSTGSPTSRSWDFGDGGSSTATSPTRTYSTPGSYTATLTVTNSSGSSQTSKTIDVAAPTITSGGMAIFINRTALGWVQAKTYVNIEPGVDPNPPAAVTVPSNYFGMHVLGPVETNLNGSGNATLWPTPAPTAVRILNVFGYSSQLGTYSGLTWRNIHRASGSFDWSLFDVVWAKLKAKGVTDVIYCLQQVPAWANGGGGSGVPPTDATALPAFIQAIDARAKANGLPISAYETWNEPNSGTSYWTGTNAQMVSLAQSLYNTVKGIDQGIPVLSPAPQGNSVAWMDSYLAAGGGQYFDILAFHGYTATDPERILWLTDNYKLLLSNYNIANKPMWDTEAMRLGPSGSAITDPAQHRDFLAVYYLTQWSKGVSRFYWYTWDSDSGKLWDYTNGINVAGQAYARVVEWMLGSVPGTVTVSGTVHSVPLTKAGKTSLAVWDSAGSSTYATSYTRMTTLANVTTTVSGSITLSKTPVLLWNP